MALVAAGQGAASPGGGSKVSFEEFGTVHHARGVDRTYTLEQIVDAYRYVETQQKVGSVVITVTPGR